MIDWVGITHGRSAAVTSSTSDDRGFHRSARLALVALDVLRGAGVTYAVVHGREDLFHSQVLTGDVDLVVARPAQKCIEETKPAFLARGLSLIAVSAYDVGGTQAAWYALRDASEGVQVDFLYDLQGVGRQGISSAGLMVGVDLEEFPPAVTDASRLVYLWRKRVWKRQFDRLPELRAAAERLPADALSRASISITGSDRTADEIQGRRDVELRPLRRPHPVLRARRVVDRLRTPVGFWAHVPTRKVASDVVATFGRLLPRSGMGEAPLPPLARHAWFWRIVQPVRLRPGLYVSYGAAPVSPQPDLTIAEPTSASAGRAAVVAAMAARF